jgi:hypothetical protein
MSDSEKTEVLHQISEWLSVKPAGQKEDQLFVLIAEELNHLINSDFNKLVSLLYRLDIDEMKLKRLLKENPGEDSGKLLATLVIERQLQKIRSRERLKSKDDIPEDEKW